MTPEILSLIEHDKEMNALLRKWRVMKVSNSPQIWMAYKNWSNTGFDLTGSLFIGWEYAMAYALSHS